MFWSIHFLRQADPISPYLFILVVGRYMQVKSNKRGFRFFVQHLIYFSADDSMLFFKMEHSTARAVQSVLMRYKSFFFPDKQWVFDKSTVVFSRNVSQVMVQDFVETQNVVKAAADITIYLGFPFNTLKREIHKFFEFEWSILEKSWEVGH